MTFVIRKYLMCDVNSADGYPPKSSTEGQAILCNGSFDQTLYAVQKFVRTEWFCDQGRYL